MTQMKERLLTTHRNLTTAIDNCPDEEIESIMRKARMMVVQQLDKLDQLHNTNNYELFPAEEQVH